MNLTSCFYGSRKNIFFISSSVPLPISKASRFTVNCAVRFRPCIDIHKGKVKQIVGSTLRDEDESMPVTNFESDKSTTEFANLYKEDGLTGGHVIMLGADRLTPVVRVVVVGGGCCIKRKR